MHTGEGSVQETSPKGVKGNLDGGGRCIPRIMAANFFHAALPAGRNKQVVCMGVHSVVQATQISEAIHRNKWGPWGLELVTVFFLPVIMTLVEALVDLLPRIY